MLPKINNTLYITVNSVDEEEAKQEYKGRIADIKDQYIFMEIPLHVKSGKLKKLYVGDEVNAYYATDGGAKNYFNTTVLGFKEDIVRLVIMKMPERDAITKVQRRNFLRVPAELEVAVKVTEQIKFVAKTEDVGGGGVSFICEAYVPVEVREVVSCWLLVPYKNGSIDHAQFKGEIVRIKELENGRKLVMLQFSEIADVERQKVIRFCFERQLDYRKN